jgi:hypothetical protein
LRQRARVEPSVDRCCIRGRIEYIAGVDRTAGVVASVGRSAVVHASVTRTSIVIREHSRGTVNVDVFWLYDGQRPIRALRD